jgi:hypothetical protein
MHVSMYAAAVPAALVWDSGVVGTLLMLGGAAGALSLAALVLRARRRRVAPRITLAQPAKAAPPLRAVA